MYQLKEIYQSLWRTRYDHLIVGVERPEKLEYLVKRVCLACRFIAENCPFCSGKGYFQYWVTYDELKAQNVTEFTIVAQRPISAISEPPPAEPQKKD